MVESMPEYEQLLKSLLQEMKNVLLEPYASDKAKVMFIENLLNRYSHFYKAPGAFSAARRIVDRSKGTE